MAHIKIPNYWQHLKPRLCSQSGYLLSKLHDSKPPAYLFPVLHCHSACTTAVMAATIPASPGSTGRKVHQATGHHGNEQGVVFWCLRKCAIFLARPSSSFQVMAIWIISSRLPLIHISGDGEWFLPNSGLVRYEKPQQPHSPRDLWGLLLLASLMPMAA